MPQLELEIPTEVNGISASWVGEAEKYGFYLQVVEVESKFRL